MRGARLALVGLALGGVALAGETQPPAERLARDGLLVERVGQLARAVVRGAATVERCRHPPAQTEAGDHLPMIEIGSAAPSRYRDVAVNASGSPPSTLQILLVDDLLVEDPRSHVPRPDPFTVVSVCEARPPNSIQCSAGAVRAMLGADPVGRPLFFLLAHELGHLLAGDRVSAYEGRTLAVDCSASRSEKVNQLRAAACTPDKRQAERESAADRFAAQVWAVTPTVGGPFEVDDHQRVHSGRRRTESGSCPPAPALALVESSLDSVDNGVQLPMTLQRAMRARAEPHDSESIDFSSFSGFGEPPCVATTSGLSMLIDLETGLSQWHAHLQLPATTKEDETEVLRDVFCRCSGTAGFPVFANDHPSPALRLRALVNAVGVIALEEERQTIEREKTESWAVPADDYSQPIYTHDSFVDHLAESARGAGVHFDHGVLTVDLDRSAATPVPTPVLQTVTRRTTERVSACHRRIYDGIEDKLSEYVAKRVDESTRFENFAAGLCTKVNWIDRRQLLPECDCAKAAGRNHSRPGADAMKLH